MGPMPWSLRWGLMMAVLRGKLNQVSYQANRGYVFLLQIGMDQHDVPKKWINRRAERREFRKKIVADLAVDRDQLVLDLEAVIPAAAVPSIMTVLDDRVIWKEVNPDAMA